MKIYSETTLEGFKAWCGAEGTKNAIIAAGKEQEFEYLIEELYPDGLSETHLNDLLWFEDEWLFESLGMSSEDEDEE